MFVEVKNEKPKNKKQNYKNTLQLSKQNAINIFRYAFGVRHYKKCAYLICIFGMYISIEQEGSGWCRGLLLAESDRESERASNST